MTSQNNLDDTLLLLDSSVFNNCDCVQHKQPEKLKMCTKSSVLDMHFPIYPLNVAGANFRTAQYMSAAYDLDGSLTMEQYARDQRVDSCSLSMKRPLSAYTCTGSMDIRIAAQAMQQLAMQQYNPAYLLDLVTKSINSSTENSREGTYRIHNIEGKASKIDSNSKGETVKEYKFKRRAKSEKKSWTRDEIVLLLQCTKLLIHCDLKTITKAIYSCVDRAPGKCWGRGAEKKLKRILSFKNWRTCDKIQISKLVNKKLREYHADNISKDSKVYRVTKELALKSVQ